MCALHEVCCLDTTTSTKLGVAIDCGGGEVLITTQLRSREIDERRVQAHLA